MQLAKMYVYIRALGWICVSPTPLRAARTELSAQNRPRGENHPAVKACRTKLK